MFLFASWQMPILRSEGPWSSVGCRELLYRLATIVGSEHGDGQSLRFERASSCEHRCAFYYSRRRNTCGACRTLPFRHPILAGLLNTGECVCARGVFARERWCACAYLTSSHVRSWQIQIFQRMRYWSLESASVYFPGRASNMIIHFDNMTWHVSCVACLALACSACAGSLSATSFDHLRGSSLRTPGT